MKRAFLFLFIIVACSNTPSYVDAAEQARATLKREGVDSVVLTPTSDPDDNPRIFQAEGTRNGKPVSGSVEVSYQGSTPTVQSHLFEVTTSAPTTKPTP